MTSGVRPLVSLLLLIAVLGGCGKSTPIPTLATAPGIRGGDGSQTPLKGFAAFGTQCASGFKTDPKAVKLELWSCPMNMPAAELTEPLMPLYLQADCPRKVLTIRSVDRSIDVNWELMPDGSFYITQDGLKAKFKDDGSGNGACSVPISMDLWGKVDCSSSNRDQATMHLETVMWLDKKTTGRPSTPTTGNPAPPPNAATAGQCSLPATKCYFHAITTLNQCS